MLAEVSALLARARAARRAGDIDSALSVLAEAADTARARGAAADERVVTWRLAKAAFDQGDLDDLRAAVDRILAVEQPFAHYPPAVEGTEPIARKISDIVGYGDDRVPRLWAAWRRHHRQLGDPWLEAQGAIHQAWHHACRWDVPAVRGLGEPYLALSPRRFGRGPTKHPDAADTTLSLYWVQADLTRILLRTATWVGDDETASEALELHLDALAVVDRRPEREPWTLDAWCRAAERFGWMRAPWSEWAGVLDRWQASHPVHALIGRATLDRRSSRPAASTFLAAAERGTRDRVGWEWVVDALHQASLESPSPDLDVRIAEIRARTSVGAAVP